MLATERHGAILLLRLARPEKRNALHPELIGAFMDALGNADRDGTRVVVVTGSGESFCAGLDLIHLAGVDAEGRVGYMRTAFELFRRLHSLPQPTIAAVNGPAMAGGFDLAALCDLRICSPRARFAQTEILLGLTQLAYPLFESIGLGRAKELALTGRVIEAEEAHRIGLVNRIVPADSLLEGALALARTLADRPPEALFATKRLCNELVGSTTGDPFDRMLDVISDRLRSAEHAAALRKYIDALQERRTGPRAPVEET